MKKKMTVLTGRMLEVPIELDVRRILESIGDCLKSGIYYTLTNIDFHF
jgi:hypothetical protein